jgi:hypothetical protein
MWDMWWDKVALGQVFSEYFSFPAIVVRSTNYSTITLMYHPGNMYNRAMWPQCWDLYEPRGLKQRDLRNQILGDLKKGPKGFKSQPTKRKVMKAYLKLIYQTVKPIPINQPTLTITYGK